MQCPNCGEETVNINGRHVCLDCGIEVMSGTGAQNNSLPVDASSDPLQTEDVNSATPKIEEDTIPEAIDPAGSPEMTEPLDNYQAPVSIPDIKEETVDDLAGMPPVLEDHQETTVSIQNEGDSVKDSSLTIENIDPGTVEDVITSSASEQIQAEQTPDLSTAESVGSEGLKKTTLEEEAMDPSILKINPSIVETPVETDSPSLVETVEKEVPISELSLSQDIPKTELSDQTDTGEPLPQEISQANNSEVSTELSQEEDIFQKEVPVDSGTPLYEEKEVQNNNAKEQLQTPPPVVNQNLKIDAVGFSAPAPASSVEANSPAVNSVDSNIFAPNFDTDHMEVMAASKVSANKIIKIIAYTSIAFVVLTLFVIIWLKRVELLTMFGMVEETPVETGMDQ